MASFAPQRVDVVYRGADSCMYHRYRDQWGWHPSLHDESYRLEGPIIDEPVIVPYGFDSYYAFGLDRDSNLVFRKLKGVNWSDWTKLYPELTWPKKPAVVARYPYFVMVVILGNDRCFHAIKYDVKTKEWAKTPQNLGGKFVDSPAITTSDVDRVEVFGTGFDGQIHKTNWTKTDGWSTDGFKAIGGSFGDRIKAVSWAPNRIDLIGTGQKGQLWHKFIDGVQEVDWKQLPGDTGSAGIPEAVTWGSGRFDLFWIGDDRKIYHNYYTKEQEWAHEAKNLGGTAVGSQLTAVSRGTELLDVFHVGLTSRIYCKTYEEQEWSRDWEPSIGVKVVALSRAGGNS